MSPNSHTVGRRQFAKLSAGALGLSAFGSTVVAAESSERYIVKRRGNKSIDVEVLHDLPEIGYAVVRTSENQLKQSNAVTSFAPDIELEIVEPVKETEPQDGEAIDDALYELQWDKQDLDIPTAHETTTGEGTSIAIIDSGVDSNHPDLDVNVQASQNFTGDGLGAGVPGGGDHGTHVAGIAAASTDGATGVAGTAPDAELLDFRVFSEFGGTNGAFSIVVAAVVEAARKNCDVANLSLGAYPIPREGLGSFYGGVLNKTMNYARKEGTLVVASAGNDASDLQSDTGNEIDIDGDGELETLEGGGWISLPNEAAGVVSVPATGPTGYAGALFEGQPLATPAESPAFYTNYGTNAVDIAAPGGDADLSMTDPVGGLPAYVYDLVLSTVTTVVTDDDGNYEGTVPGYGWKAGTSMAAPNVAGAAALVKSNNPDYSANQVRSALENAAEVPDDYDKTYYGAGYLNVLDAL
jgi:subtilisin family serine protease